MISLLSSIALCLCAFSFAWINWNVDLNSNSIKLTSGESVLYVDYYGYYESRTVPLFPSDTTTSSSTSELRNPIKTYITSTGEQNGSQGAYEVTTNFTFTEPASLLDFYVGEHTFNYDLLPKIYLEFQYLKDVFDGYIKAAVKVSTSDTSKVLEFYHVTESNTVITESNPTGYEHILRKDRTDYNFKQETISDSIQLFPVTNPEIPQPPEDGYSYTIDPQLKVPEYNYHKDGKLLYSKATLIMIKFNSANFIKYLADNIESTELKISLNFTITFNYSNDPYYTKVSNNNSNSSSS